MKAWKKAAIGVVSVLTMAGGANLAAMAAGSDDSSRIVDVKGPCDEPEHANDPQCAGPQVLEDNGRERGDDRGREQERRGRDGENDNRGHDDGAEDRDDNSGPGSENEGPSDNSGHGGHDDSSGHDDGGNED